MTNGKNCDYCGTEMLPEDEICPSCGAPNLSFAPGGEVRTRRPRTIAELKEFCASKGMPLEKMRFFIGTNELSPKAFGIYQEGSRFIVYKNKADGSRAVRYEGPDESYAVDQLYEKLLDEHRLRRDKGSGSSGERTSTGRRRSFPLSAAIVVVFLVVCAFNLLSSRISHRKDGYYQVDDQVFYRYGSSWYSDYGGDEWYETEYFPESNYGDYYVGEDYDAEWGGSSFEESGAWESLQDSSDDSGWDYDDYDYDDWDSGDTDWDSDW